jgi:D-glycero-D-manno-heptose 1,7-bisphosphate phosphatase
MSHRAVFLDREGTVTVGVPKYERVDSLSKVELLPQVFDALELLAGLDYQVFFVTNQAGIAEGLISWEDFNEINEKVLSLIQPTGIKIQETYVCPHGDHDNCECRKPKPKLLFDAAKEYDIDLANSWMIGDRPSDVMTGVNAGTKTSLVLSGVPTVESDQATVTLPTLLEAVEYIARQGQ